MTDIKASSKFSRHLRIIIIYGNVAYIMQAKTIALCNFLPFPAPSTFKLKRSVIDVSLNVDFRKGYHIVEYLEKRVNFGLKNKIQ